MASRCVHNIFPQATQCAAYASEDDTASAKSGGSHESPCKGQVLLSMLHALPPPPEAGRTPSLDQGAPAWSDAETREGSSSSASDADDDTASMKSGGSHESSVSKGPAPHQEAPPPEALPARTPLRTPLRSSARAFQPLAPACQLTVPAAFPLYKQRLSAAAPSFTPGLMMPMVPVPQVVLEEPGRLAAVFEDFVPITPPGSPRGAGQGLGTPHAGGPRAVGTAPEALEAVSCSSTRHVEVKPRWADLVDDQEEEEDDIAA